MPFYSPLRYPGGKRRLSTFVTRLLKTNNMKEIHYVEPFAGGASLALALLFGEHASVIHINDMSRPVYAFWHSVLNNTEELCRRIENVEVSMSEWYLQKTIYASRDDADLNELGFATFFLNRTNRSGIIGGGVIGGKNQSGKWSLDARFTKKELIQRIHRISRYSDRIRLYNQDGIKFTSDIISGLTSNTFVFLDPPYIEKGQQLYLNNYSIFDHRRLEAEVTRLEQSWVVTYDYEAAVRHELYRNYPRLAFQLSYSTQSRQMGKEALFLSANLQLPSEWDSPQLVSISGRESSYPVFGKLEKSQSPVTLAMDDGLAQLMAPNVDGVN